VLPLTRRPPRRSPLPAQCEGPSQLPSMTAAAVCKRMLFTLWELHRTDSTSDLIESGSKQLPSRLAPCLVQLGPRFAPGEVMYTLSVQVSAGANHSELYVCQIQQSLVRVAAKGEVWSTQQSSTRHVWWCVVAQHACDNYSGPQQALAETSSNAVGSILACLELCRSLWPLEIGLVIIFIGS